MKLDRIVLSAGTLMKANFPEYIITIIISRVCSFDISVSFALCIICMTTSGMEFPALFRPPPHNGCRAPNICFAAERNNIKLHSLHLDFVNVIETVNMQVILCFDAVCYG